MLNLWFFSPKVTFRHNSILYCMPEKWWPKLEHSYVPNQVQVPHLHATYSFRLSYPIGCKTEDLIRWNGLIDSARHILTD